MGKSGRKKKKPGAPDPPSDDNKPHPISSTTTTTTAAPPSSIPNGGGPTFAVDPSVLLKRAHDLKEEGNRRFQAKDYAGALEQYELALKLTPRFHPDRAVFHSNRAACLLQMRPPDYHAAAAECSLALQSQPGFPRALLRRARAFEALGKPELALADVNALLASDPTNSDALDIARRLRTVVGVRGGDVGGQQQQQELSSRPSPAALGASAVGAPIAGLGPCLPSRSASKKTSPPPPLSKPVSAHDIPELHSNSTVGHPPPSQNTKSQHKPVVLKPFKSNTPTPSSLSSVTTIGPDDCTVLKNDNSNGQLNHSVGRPEISSAQTEKPTKWRPLKLVYGHDIRLAQMPARCTFGGLRDIVTKRFPSSKSVLIKYKDEDGDLVTVTSTAELRLAESIVDEVAATKEDGSAPLRILRLHIVEVSPEQEPEVPEEVEQEQDERGEKPKEDEVEAKDDRSVLNSSGGESVAESLDNGSTKTISAEEVLNEKVTGHKECNHAECKEVEIDDWLFEFSQLFRTQVGIDPDAHLDLHELGMELCAEALEEAVTSEEAQTLFEMAASKFQEVAALAFFNWGNVHMCAARKRIPLDEHAPKDVYSVQLHSAYDWVRERYTLAGQKYEEALRIKPDFYEGLLALGQQHFETAKLQWSFALANKVDIASWDSTETFALFENAEEKMKAATEIWEKLEEERSKELKDPATSKKEELLKRRKKQALGADSQASANIPGELTAEEAAEQAAVVRSQIHLFWGNLLFERSQVEFKLGFSGWKKNLDAAVERFKLAGASEADISAVIKNHSSNEVNLDEKKREKLDCVLDIDVSNAFESAST